MSKVEKGFTYKDSFIWSDGVADGGVDLTGKTVRYARIPDLNDPYTETAAVFTAVAKSGFGVKGAKLSWGGGKIFLDNGETIYRRQVKEVMS